MSQKAILMGASFLLALSAFGERIFDNRKPEYFGEFACMDVPPAPSPTPAPSTPSPTPTPTPTPTPPPCEWQTPNLNSGSGTQQSKSIWHSNENVDPAPTPLSINPGILNLVADNVVVSGSRSGFYGYLTTPPNTVRTVYLEREIRRDTTVRAKHGSAPEHQCGSYTQVGNYKYDFLAKSYSWSYTAFSNPVLWSDTTIVRSDTVRDQGSNGSSSYLKHTLSSPYTVEEFLGRLDIAPFLGTFDDAYFGRVRFWLSSGKTGADVHMTRFKWVWGDQVLKKDRYSPPQYVVVFKPYNDLETPQDESANVKMVSHVKWDSWETANESPVFEFNPFKLEGKVPGEYEFIPIEVRAHQYVTGPHGSPPMYSPSQPENGDASDELFSLWPNEKVTFRVGEPLAGMLQRSELPAGTVKWTADGLAGQSDTDAFEVQWAVHGTKKVTLNIGAMQYQIWVNIPNTGSYNLNSPNLIAAVGVDGYVRMGLLGAEARDFIAARYGENSASGGTKQDAIRHSTWNAMCAQSVGMASTLLVTTANEYSGQHENNALSSNCSMDLHNNGKGATLGNESFPGAKTPTQLAVELEAKYDNGELAAWTPPLRSVSNHSNIIRKSNQGKFFKP